MKRMVIVFIMLFFISFAYALERPTDFIDELEFLDGSLTQFYVNVSESFYMLNLTLNVTTTQPSIRIDDDFERATVGTNYTNTGSVTMYDNHNLFPNPSAGSPAIIARDTAQLYNINFTLQIPSTSSIDSINIIIGNHSNYPSTGSELWGISCIIYNAEFGCYNGTNEYTLLADVVNAGIYNIEIYDINHTSKTYEVKFNESDLGTQNFRNNLTNMTRLILYHQNGGWAYIDNLSMNYKNIKTGNINISLGGNSYSLSNAVTTDYSNLISLSTVPSYDNTKYPSKHNITFNASSDATNHFKIKVHNATSYTTVIDDCTNTEGISSNGTASTINFYDLDNNSLAVNVSTTITYTEWDLNNSFEKTQTNNISICIYPSFGNTSGAYNPLEYFYADSAFNYYTEGTIFTNITKNISLYVDTAPTAITATVYDNKNSRVEDVYIHVQRYDSSTNSYSLVGIFKTNFEGETILYLTQNTVFYRFLLYYPIDTLKKTTTPTYIISSSIEFQIDLYENVAEDYYTSMGVDTELTFNNNTNNFRYIYSDPSGNIGGATLKVWKTTGNGNVLYNESTLTTTSGTILINVAEVNDTSYLAKAYISLPGQDYFMDSLSHTFHGESITSMMGLFAVFLVTIVFGFLFLFSIPIAVIAIPLPTLFASMIKLINLDVHVAIGMELAALVIAVFINNRG